jgi:hypothetical protein
MDHEFCVPDRNRRRISVATQTQARVASLFLLAQVLKIGLRWLNRAGHGMRGFVDQR